MLKNSMLKVRAGFGVSVRKGIVIYTELLKPPFIPGVRAPFADDFVYVTCTEIIASVLGFNHMLISFFSNLSSWSKYVNIILTSSSLMPQASAISFVVIFL